MSTVEQKQSALNRICFPVSKIQRGENHFSIINRESGAVLSNVSSRYCLVHNADVFLPFAEKFGVERLSALTSYGSGKYYIGKFYTGREFNFGTFEKPDICKEQIIIQNSYNKTKSFSFMFGAFRMVCSNGLYSGEALINYKKIHVGTIPIQELVKEVFCQYEKNHFESWKRLQKIPLTLESQIKLLEGFDAVNVPTETSYVAKKLNSDVRWYAKHYLNKPETVDNQRTAWGLLNQVNRGIADKLRGKSQIGTLINANKRLEDYLLKTLVN